MSIKFDYNSKWPSSRDNLSRPIHVLSAVSAAAAAASAPSIVAKSSTLSIKECHSNSGCGGNGFSRTGGKNDRWGIFRSSGFDVSGEYLNSATRPNVFIIATGLANIEEIQEVSSRHFVLYRAVNIQGAANKSKPMPYF